MNFERIQTLPQDIINHIGEFYVTREMKLHWRIDKLYTKVEELDKRTIDEWINHIKFSKRYSVTIVKIDDYLQYTNSFGDKMTIHKNDLIHQGYIYHIRHLYRLYVQRIISSSTPEPKYKGETFINIVGQKMTAKYSVHTKHLVFTH
jgi:hypothetical protein